VVGGEGMREAGGRRIRVGNVDGSRKRSRRWRGEVVDSRCNCAGATVQERSMRAHRKKKGTAQERSPTQERVGMGKMRG
jgi:hypothetical protein